MCPIGRQPEIGVVPFWRAWRVEQCSLSINPNQTAVLAEGPRIRDSSGARGRHCTQERGATAHMFSDEERLALEFEALCVKRLAQQRVSVHEQQIAGRRID